MLEFFKTWTSRRKGKPSTEGGVAEAKITREEIRDLFSDVLTQKTAAHR